MMESVPGEIVSISATENVFQQRSCAMGHVPWDLKSVETGAYPKLIHTIMSVMENVALPSSYAMGNVQG